MTISLRAMLPLVLGAFLLVGLSIGAEKSSFTEAAFEAAQKAGKPILIDIAAPWCPTCKAQAPILNELAALPKFKDLEVFTVDFDNQKSALRTFKAQSQSTLIVFKGAAEVGRSVGDTSKASIEALLAKSL
jgi:thioredoxin 1